MGLPNKDKLADVVTETAKAAPPAGVAGMQMAGIPISEWVLLLTAAYTVLLIVHKSIQVLQAVRQKPDGCRPGCHERRCSAGDTPS